MFKILQTISFCISSPPLVAWTWIWKIIELKAWI